MSVTAVIGAQWGDEGKGKIVDYLAQRSNVVVRFNGGANAGHTVSNQQGEFRLHLIPAGIFNPNALCIIGNGVVVDAEVLREELNELQKRGISCANLRISTKANLLFPWHILQDELEELRRGPHKIGTTKKGIGPAFEDKISRKGIRVGWLLQISKPKIRDRLILLQKEKTDFLRWLGGEPDSERLIPVLEWVLRQKEALDPFIAETEPILWEAIEGGKEILLEGAQGTLLDIDFGTYPDVTASLCTAAGASQGTGIPINKIDTIIGVMKAYTTRVGSQKQSFPTEMPPELADSFRKRAGEYGATTGRPRRIGWLDAVLLCYAAKINGFTSLALTRLDTLTAVSPLKICWGYKVGDKIISCFSLRQFSIDMLERAEPLYIIQEGWSHFPEKARDICDLPVGAHRYIRTIENLVGVKIQFISTGPKRDQMIELK